MQESLYEHILVYYLNYIANYTHTHTNLLRVCMTVYLLYFLQTLDRILL